MGFVITSQKLAPASLEILDDSAAHADWDWAPRYDLDAMTKDMLARLTEKLKPAPRRQRT